jgi:CDP-4-dehydro-6-deoxyglucose reductase, E1
MKYFEYEIHSKLSNADYLHYDGFFVGNHQEEIKDKILALNNVFK